MVLIREKLFCNIKGPTTHDPNASTTWQLLGRLCRGASLHSPPDIQRWSHQRWSGTVVYFILQVGPTVPSHYVSSTQTFTIVGLTIQPQKKYKPKNLRVELHTRTSRKAESYIQRIHLADAKQMLMLESFDKSNQ